MRFDFISDRDMQVKSLLKEHDVSRSLLAKVKFRGGDLQVNNQTALATDIVRTGDKVTMIIPDEEDKDGRLQPVFQPLTIVYEDEHFLVLNKPFGVASIPSSIHSNTMANFVKAYYISKGYPNKQVHIVTRLDRDTTGLMLFAKHGYAHARLDKQLQDKTIDKRYYALVSGQGGLSPKGDIIAPIGRPKDSIITRCISPDGKYAHTSYELVADYGEVKLVAIKLHTGRTHQIRVHFAHIGFPLLGDDLYGGRMDLGIERQALHCYELAFVNPFLGQPMTHTLPLTEDMENVIINMTSKRK